MGTKWTKQTPKKLPENPKEMKLIFNPKTKAIGGKIVGDTIINIINFLKRKFNKPKTLAAGKAIIIETTVTRNPIVKLLIKALITAGLLAQSSIKPSKVLCPGLGISFNLTHACKLNSLGIIWG